MNPAIVKLFPTVMQLLDEASKTEAGQKYLDKGKRVVEVSLPYIKDASELAIDFLSTDVGKELFGDVKNIKLSKKLDVVDRGLSLPSSYDKNQSASIKQKITDGFEITKGQSEILFLSNSINYFIDSHKFRVGIDRNISYALQYDVNAVTEYLKKRSDIRFPGYLLHQLQSLSSTIRELNIFYASLCNDGYVSDYNEEDLLAKLNKKYGAEGKASESIGYYPCDMMLYAKRCLGDSVNQNKPSPSGRFFAGKIFDKGEVASGVHDALEILNDELIFNEKLESNIVEKLKIFPNNKLLIESF
ncbi:MAG: hypothetical protein GYB38_01530 [Gammaproteobacteria bacterium]|nr:hypothetical protein [Gammaproteobacteria bacterium]